MHLARAISAAVISAVTASACPGRQSCIPPIHFHAEYGSCNAIKIEAAFSSFWMCYTLPGRYEARIFRGAPSYLGGLLMTQIVLTGCQGPSAGEWSWTPPQNLFVGTVAYVELWISPGGSGASYRCTNWSPIAIPLYRAQEFTNHRQGCYSPKNPSPVFAPCAYDAYMYQPGNPYAADLAARRHLYTVAQRGCELATHLMLLEAVGVQIVPATVPTSPAGERVKWLNSRLCEDIVPWEPPGWGYKPFKDLFNRSTAAVPILDGGGVLPAVWGILAPNVTVSWDPVACDDLGGCAQEIRDHIETGTGVALRVKNNSHWVAVKAFRYVGACSPAFLQFYVVDPAACDGGPLEGWRTLFEMQATHYKTARRGSLDAPEARINVWQSSGLVTVVRDPMGREAVFESASGVAPGATLDVGFEVMHEHQSPEFPVGSSPPLSALSSWIAVRNPACGAYVVTATALEPGFHEVMAGFDGVKGYDIARDGREMAVGETIEMEIQVSCGPKCYADCNGDGALTVADFGCFQTAFVAGSPLADCNGDGALTVADFGCFQTKYTQGCP